jgi:hypothetical protein
MLIDLLLIRSGKRATDLHFYRLRFRGLAHHARRPPPVQPLKLPPSRARSPKCLKLRYFA